MLRGREKGEQAMAVICARADGEPWDGLEACATELVEVAPRAATTAGGVLWLDGRGLGLKAAARAAAVALARLETASGRRWGVALARVPVAAYVAAGEALGAANAAGAVERERVAIVTGEARAWLAGRPLSVLEPEPRLAALLEGVGIETCGMLAALAREAVEVRFGAEGLVLWRWARGDDERRLFRASPRVAESASLDFIDYVVTDPERLVFATNALLGTVCDALESRGAHARGIRLVLALADGGAWERVLRSGRSTASRTTWLRVARSSLERLTVPDAVTGIAVAVEREEAAGVVQGDLFDPGFGTAAAVEAALVRLLEDGAAPIVRPLTSAHPLAERRARFETMEPEATLAQAGVTRTSSSASEGDDSAAPSAGLTLQLLATPRPVRVETERRRDHEVPVRYRDRDRGWRRVINAAGPDRVSGGQWEDAYAREYFRVVDEAGALVWLYRDGRKGRWYVQGWWD
jgi:hypothetical protein